MFNSPLTPMLPRITVSIVGPLFLFTAENDSAGVSGARGLTRRAEHTSADHTLNNNIARKPTTPLACSRARVQKRFLFHCWRKGYICQCNISLRTTQHTPSWPNCNNILRARSSRLAHTKPSEYRAQQIAATMRAPHSNRRRRRSP